jgi:hypothetical protein
MGNRRRTRVSGTAASAVATSPITRVNVRPKAVTDGSVIARQRAFEEAVRQSQPIASAGTREAGQASKFVRETTALPRGLRPSTSNAHVTRHGKLADFVSGANPTGKTKEVIAALDYQDLHGGRDVGMVNPPGHVAPNVESVRLSPDPSSRRDLLFQVRTREGMLLTVPGGQVKSGSAQYVADALVEMAGKPGYGRTGYVDARFVNPDGTPRIAPDGFTVTQARRLRDADVRLRGVRDLDSRGNQLFRDLTKHEVDGLDPASRQELLQLRDDIALAYRPRRVAGRMAGAAAAAAATAAVISIAVQYATAGKLDVAAVRDAAGGAAVAGGIGALADAVLYHLAKGAGVAPEAARAIAQQGVAVGFCLFAVGVDANAEIQDYKIGNVSGADALFGGASKAALDFLPLLLGPLGVAGIPVLIGAQLGGRWALAKVRASERRLEVAIAEDFATAHGLDQRFDSLVELSDQDDEIFRRLMGDGGSPPPALRAVHSK